MKKLLTYLIPVLLLASACHKKELPVQDSEEPVFFMDYFLDGVNKRMEAGNDDYFMNTSWSLDSNHHYVLKADLSQISAATQKGYALSVLVNDLSVSTANSLMNTDSILRIGSHLLNDQLIPGTTQNVSFRSDKTFDAASDYQWVITDGKADVRTVSAYSLSADFPIGKTYSVSLRYDDGLGGCITTHTNVFRIGNKLQTRIIAKRDTTTPEFKYIFSYPLPYTGSNFSCAWKFADGSTSSMKSPSHLFVPGTSIVSLMLVDLTSHDTCYSYYQLNASNVSKCEANFSASFEPVINSNFYATATVLLTDPNGLVYSSRLAQQPSSSNFEIESVSNYKTNANGFPTKSIKLKFNCLLKNGNKEITLSNAQGIMAVAYKP